MNADLRRLALIGIAVIAGCGAPSAGGPSASPRVVCTGIPAAKCDEAVASVARSLPNTAVVAIEVNCVAGTCTTASGAMDTVVTLPDGSQLRSTTNSWATGGGQGVEGGDTAPVQPPVPEPMVPVEPVCQGVPVSSCKTMAETAFGELTDQDVVQIVVRCKEPPCTDAHGVGDTVVTYGDGTTQSSSWEYATN